MPTSHQPGAPRSEEPRVVMTTVATATEAERLARLLVDEELVACVQIVPGLTSVYRWQGAVCEESEHLLLLKTVAGAVPDLEGRLLQEHPYSAPEFVVLEASASRQYANWLKAQVAATD